MLNPAPFQAFLSFGFAHENGTFPLELVATPERFLRVSPDGDAQVKPIKGTSGRGANPEEDELLARMLATDEKELAEHLMIVDLMRNDLSMVSKVGSVHCRATELMQVETFANYHQLVSTVPSAVEGGMFAGRCAARALPPG